MLARTLLSSVAGNPVKPGSPHTTQTIRYAPPTRWINSQKMEAAFNTDHLFHPQITQTKAASIFWNRIVTTQKGLPGFTKIFHLALAIVCMSSPALAASRIVTIDELAITNGRLTVQVPAGDGVVIDLSSIGQIVRGVGFGDATKFVISGIDGQLCYMQQDECSATGASVISFRQVKGIEIPTQSHSPDGSTTATLTTDGRLGRKVLHMRLIPAVQATYTAIVVTENSTSVLPVVTHTTTAFFPIDFSNNTVDRRIWEPTLKQRSDANALAMGLRMANPRNNNIIKIDPHSAQYMKVQNAIIALRKGKSREDAALVSGLELLLIEQLIYLGQKD